jgi:signal transduction histidine kinase/ActR/RegA family two-component response regulator
MADSTSTKMSDLAALESITEVALATLDLDDLLHGLIRRMVEVSGAQAGVILLLEQDELVPRATFGLDVLPIDAYRVPLDESFAGQVLRQGKPIGVRNVHAPGGPPTFQISPHITSVLGVPLKAGGRTIGVARIDLREERDFTPREVHRFEVLADRAAIAIEHSRLLRESRERNAELEATNAELARTNAELERANAELRAVDRLKTDFLSMVSHELRTPLTAIIGYTDLLLRGTHGDLNERQVRHQQAVRNGALRLLALINDLLDVSRLDSGLVELDLTEVSLTEVVDQAVAGAREAATGAQLSLRVELPTNLPAVRGDRARLVQVMANLLSNAVKFTPPGGRVDVWAISEAEGQQVRVCVRDTGAGIAPEHLQHIWDRFYQADSSVRRRYGGTGLGLAIVRGLIDLHGGLVEAESPGPGEGATFSFDLPAVAASHQTPQTSQPFDVRGATVLVVEDERDNRELIAMMLQEVLGVEVISASDGLEGLEQAAHKPDLILLDLMLPRLDGFEVVRALKADERLRDIPVLALTGLTRPSERDEALAAGCKGVIVKPFDTEDLIRSVAEQLRVKPEV